MKHKKPHYIFELLTIKLLREKCMHANFLHEGWRGMPDNLLRWQQQYYKNPTQKALKFVMRRDTVMYYGILDMLEKRKKRTIPLKFEMLLTKHNLSITETTSALLKTRYACLFLRSEFIRTGKGAFITQLRNLDKQLTNDLIKFIESTKKY